MDRTPHPDGPTMTLARRFMSTSFANRLDSSRHAEWQQTGAMPSARRVVVLALQLARRAR